MPLNSLPATGSRVTRYNVYPTLENIILAGTGIILTWNHTARQRTIDGGQAASTATWGSISGTLSNQADLQGALDGKAAASHTHVIADVGGLQTALDGKQALDADLTAIAGLTGTSGFLKKTAADTWALDTASYLPLTGGDLTGGLTGTSGAFSGALSTTGGFKESGSVHGARFENTGSGAAPGATGVGVEIIGRSGGASYLQSYDRTAVGFAPLIIRGSKVHFSTITTTASAANAFLDSGDSNNLLRSTSSLKYKTQVEALQAPYADAILSLRPVWYRSLAKADNPDWSFYGLIAEEVAQIDPRLVHYGYQDDQYETVEVEPESIDPETGEIVPARTEKRVRAGEVKRPDGVQYERLTVLLLDIVKRQQARIEALEAKVLV